MANIQNQKTASGGSVVGSWNVPLPGLPCGVVLPETSEAFIQLSASRRMLSHLAPVA
jgi:hypothetical protein